MRKATSWLALAAIAGWTGVLALYLDHREKLVYWQPNAVEVGRHVALDLVVIDRGSRHSHVYEVFFRSRGSELPAPGNTFFTCSDSVAIDEFQVERTGPASVIVRFQAATGLTELSGSFQSETDVQIWSVVHPASPPP